MRPRTNPHTQQLTKRRADRLGATGSKASKLDTAIARKEALEQRWDARQQLTLKPATARAKLARGDDLEALQRNLALLKSKTAGSSADDLPDPTRNRFAPLGRPPLTPEQKQKRADAKLHSQRAKAASAARKIKQNPVRDAAEKTIKLRSQQTRLREQLEALPKAGRLAEITRLKELVTQGEITAAHDGIAKIMGEVAQERRLAVARIEYERLVRDEANVARRVTKLVEDALDEPTFPSKNKLKPELQRLQRTAERQAPPTDVDSLVAATLALSNRTEEWGNLEHTYATLKQERDSSKKSQRPPLPPLGDFRTITNHTDGAFDVAVRVDWSQVYDNSAYGKKIAVNPTLRGVYQKAMHAGYIASTNTGESGVKKEPNLWIVKVSYPDAKVANVDNTISLIARDKDPSSTPGLLRLTFTSAELRH